MAQISPHDPDMDTLTEPALAGIQECSLAVIKDCNIRERWDNFNEVWMNGHVTGSNYVGCGINVLFILDEMNTYTAIGKVRQLTNNPSSIGTSMTEMINLLNSKSQEKKSIEKRAFFKIKNIDFIIYNPDRISINREPTRNRLYIAYKFIFESMPDNSCMILKYMRNPDELQRERVTLTHGHTVVLTRILKGNGTSELYSVDPQAKEGPRLLKLSEWAGDEMVSINSYNALVRDNWYRSFCIIEACSYTCNTLVNLCNNLPPNIVNMTQNDLIMVKNVSNYLSRHRQNIISIRGGGTESFEDISDLLPEKYGNPSCSINSRTNKRLRNLSNKSRKNKPQNKNTK